MRILYYQLETIRHEHLQLYMTYMKQARLNNMSVNIFVN